MVLSESALIIISMCGGLPSPVYSSKYYGSFVNLRETNVRSIMPRGRRGIFRGWAENNMAATLRLNAIIHVYLGC